MGPLLASLKPVRNPPANFWTIDKADLILLCVGFVSQGAIYFAYWSTLSLSHAITFQDCVTSAAAAKFMIKDLEVDPFAKVMRTSRDHFIPPTPVYPVILVVCITICMGSMYYGQFLALCICSCLSIYTFRRMITLLRVAEDPFFTTFLFCIAPMRWTFLRVTATSDSLFLSLTFVAFIFFTLKRNFLFVIFLLLAGLTRVEGMLLYIVFTILFLLRRNFWMTVGVTLMGSSHFIVVSKFTRIKESLVTFVTFPYSGGSGTFSRFPFQYFIQIATSINNLRVIHAYVTLFGPPLLGSISLLLDSLPLGVFSLVWIGFSSLLPNFSFYRLMVPAQVVSILLGFDMLWRDPRAKKLIYGFSVVLITANAIYARGESTKLNFPSHVWTELAYA
jgi:hypothetical protein